MDNIPIDSFDSNINSIAEFKLTTELFAIPYNDKFIVYSPLKRLAFIANQEAVNVLYKLEKGTLTKLNEPTEKIVEMLKKVDIINGEPDKPPVNDNIGSEFAPTDVMIFPTSDCNLRCIYCYGNGGENPKYIKWEVAKAAIDLVVKNAIKNNKGHFGVGFHGGGEPTLAWDILVKCTLYAKELAQRNNLKTSIFTATNGILDADQIKWIATNLDHVMVSFDGTKVIQDCQRPMANGGSSYNKVLATVQIFDTLKVNYSIRTTITSESVTEMTKIINFFYKHFKTKNFQFVPISICGRCTTTKCDAVPSINFIKEFRLARKRSDELSLNLISLVSGIENIQNMHCGANTPNLCVTPEGYVTSCLEVISLDDPRSQIFIYGRFDENKSKFLLDKNKIDYLRSKTIDTISYCSECISKWHCAGGCLAKNATSSFGNPSEDSRCEVIQELTKDQIIEIFRSN